MSLQPFIIAKMMGFRVGFRVFTLKPKPRRDQDLLYGDYLGLLENWMSISKMTRAVFN